MIEFQIKKKKQAMGVSIFESMRDADHKTAEDIFMATKLAVDAMNLTMAELKKELKLLNEAGESDIVSKPGSSQ